MNVQAVLSSLFNIHIVNIFKTINAMVLRLWLALL